MPKAAGTSLIAVIRKQYRAPRVLDLGRHPVERYVEAFRRLAPKERAQVDFVHGHYPFGLHRLIPRPCTYVTLLREPVARVISHYHQVLRDPNHYAYERGFTPEMSLMEYVESGVTEQEISDGQARFLAGEGPEETLLERAIAHGETQYAVVGTSERFDESLLLMKRRLGWRRPFYLARHVHARQSRRASVSAEVIAAIEARNERDVHLYRHFSERLQQQIEEAGPAFRREVRRFKALNGLYGHYRKTRQQAGRVKRRVHHFLSQDA